MISAWPAKRGEGTDVSKRYRKELTPAQVAALPGELIDTSDIPTSDIPELEEAFWKSARLVEPEGTEQVTLRMKQSVLQTFKATGKGYQTRMNALLESYARTLRKQG